MNERQKVVKLILQGKVTMTAACEEFGISRNTGYKILSRHETHGMAEAHPTWGSKKILQVLVRERPDADWPARSTVDAIMKRAGVVPPRGRRRRRQPSSPPVIEAAAPNDVWSMDYKGWFRVGDGTRCDPLTVNDVFSRASLECRAMVSPKSADVRTRLVSTFRAFGLPRFMLSDGGPLFGSTGLGRMSRLGVWLVRVGVTPVLIEPGRPDQNGRHERFHETLKAETASPPSGTIRSQQAALDYFQQDYNDERPHEALQMKTPAEVYEFPRQFFGVEEQYSEGGFILPEGIESPPGCELWEGQ